MRLTRAIAPWAFAACAAASLAAAGPARAADATGVTDTAVKVGVFGPMTGPAAAFGKGILGLEAIYKDANDHGGIAGRKIEIVQEDDGCDPAKGIAAIKKLIAQDQVFMIHGGSCSNVVLAVKPELEKAGIPYMVGAAASTQIAVPVQPNIFQAVPNTDAVAQAMVDFALSKPGARKIALISHSDEWGKSNHDPAVAYLKKAHDLDPVMDVALERGSTDATPQILKLKGAAPDVILAMLYPAELAIFERDAYKYGLRVPVLGNQAISIEDTRSRAGSAAAVANLYVYYPLAAPVGDPAMQKWEEISRKYYPDMRVESASMLAMGGAITMLHVLQQAGRELTREKLIDGLNHVTNFDTGVLSAPVTFTPDNHAGVKGGAFITYKGDKLVILRTFEPKS